MSKPPEHENGAHGANAVNGTPGAYDTHGGIQSADVREVPPNVYHPQAEPSPTYETYLDPAAAHGWQNAYDETTELPPVVDGADGVHEDRGAGGALGPSGVSGGYVYEGGYDYVYEDGHDYGDDYDAGRGGRRSHRGRHQPGGWLTRRFAVAAGAVGAVSLAVLIAGFSLFGSSSDGGTTTKVDRTSTTSGFSLVPGEPTAGVSAGDRRSDDADSSRSASPGASASPSASDDADADSDSGDKTDKPSTAPSTTSEAPPPPTATATPTTDKPGRGLGNTKRPG